MKLFFLPAFALTLATSCENDDPAALPSVNAPNSVLTVETGATIEVAFSFTSEAGLSNAELTSVNGDASLVTNVTTGQKSGNIVVSFTGGSSAGAGSVILRVKDMENQESSATAVISVVEEQIIFNVTGNITQNTTWKSGKVYILESRVSVVSGVTLTIEPGVIVKGQAGTGPNATAFLIARGATILAEGTAADPIIFTSVADEIMPGEIASPNLDPDLNGLWGGLIVLGNAPISAVNPSIQIEGIPASDPNGLYGGNVPDDNSGILRYISIRHGGSNIGEGNEINGLTLGGVGSGTVIENIEIVANQDDGVEWFGGSVSVTNLVVWNNGDDAIDTDQAWSGTLDNFVVYNPGDEIMELDGPEGTLSAGHIIKNGSVYAGSAEGLVDLDENSIVEITNVYFNGLAAGQDFDLNPTGLTASALQATLPEGSALTDFFKAGSDLFTTAVTEGNNTVGANITVFEDWSWISVAGVLNDTDF